MFARLATVAGLSLFLGLGCFDTEPCDVYVSYMCDCHSETFDCAELQAIYEGADATIQDQCATELSTQQDQDEADGLACEAATSSSGR